MSRRPLVLVLAGLVTSCEGYSGFWPRSTPDRTLDAPATIPEGPSAADCTAMTRDVEVLVASLASDAAGTPRPTASSLDDMIYGHLDQPLIEAGPAHLELYEGLMISCDEGRLLAGDLLRNSRRWSTIAERLPTALLDCGCMLNNDALLGWIWVAAQLWPPDHTPTAPAPEASEDPLASEITPPNSEADPPAP